MNCISSTKKIVVLLVLISAIQVSSSTGWIEIKPYEGNVDSSFWVKGGGFTPNSMVAIVFENTKIEITNANFNGDISVRVKVPETSCGYHRVMAVDEVKNNAYAFFNVTPHIDLGKRVKKASPGSVITIVGKGFSANSEVKVRFVNGFYDLDTIELETIEEKTVISNEKGSFEMKFEVPNVAPGYYLIYAHDSKCGVDTKYLKLEVLEVKTTPTPTPTPKPKNKVVQNELVKQDETVLVTPQTTPKTPKIIKTSDSKKQTPGFEFLLALGGITTALLISRKLSK